MTPLRRLVLIACAAVCLLAPASAWASGNDVIRDCTDDGQLSKKYTQQEYAQALGDIPTDVDEYTDCRDVIRRAQLGDTSGGGGTGGSTGGGGGGGGGTTTGSGGGVTGAPGDPLAGASPKELASIRSASSGGGKPVKIAGRLVQPGNLGFGGLGAPEDLPTALLIILIVTGLAVAGGGGALLRNHVLARRSP